MHKTLLTTGTTNTENLPTFTIDHFKFWELEQPVGTNYARPFRGQFDTDSWSASAISLTHLANPVVKNGEPILNDKLHLLVYTVEPVAQDRLEVTLWNQFTKTETDPHRTETWSIDDRALLLMPAGKLRSGNPDWPDSARAYVCYRAKGPSVQRGITLLDQFDKPPFRPSEKPENLTRLEPKYFCVPELRNNEQPSGNDHLAIYEFLESEQEKLAPPIRVVVRDSFHPAPMPVRAAKSVMLAVPSFKVRWKPANLP